MGGGRNQRLEPDRDQLPQRARRVSAEDSERRKSALARTEINARPELRRDAECSASLVGGAGAGYQSASV